MKNKKSYRVRARFILRGNYQIRKKYGMKFPKQWCGVFTRILPITKGSYNWRDMSDENSRMKKWDPNLGFNP